MSNNSNAESSWSTLLGWAILLLTIVAFGVLVMQPMGARDVRSSVAPLAVPAESASSAVPLIKQAAEGEVAAASPAGETVATELAAPAEAEPAATEATSAGTEATPAATEAAPAATEATPAATEATSAGTEATPAATEAAPAATGGVPAAASAEVVAAVNKGTCIACHTIPGVPGAVGMVGPDLTNIGTEAGTRIPGTSAEEYIHQSIVDPNAFIAPECPYGLNCNAGSMLPNLATTMSEGEIKLIVDYLVTLTGGAQ